MDNESIKSEALAFAHKNGKQIAKDLTDLNIFPSKESPISIFMAGSPGAGKTEFSKNIIKLFEKDNNHQVIRIDGDDIRLLLPGYTGNNSSLFQNAVSIIVEKIHDRVLSQKQNFIFDGTFSKYEKAADNIKRSLNKRRRVFIFYVYQNPETAWRFTKKREEAEGRNIPKESFIEQFFGAKDTVNRIHDEFKNQVTIFLVKKDFEKNTVEKVLEIKPENPSIDDCIQHVYTKIMLNETL